MKNYKSDNFLYTAEKEAGNLVFRTKIKFSNKIKNFHDNKIGLQKQREKKNPITEEMSVSLQVISSLKSIRLRRLYVIRTRTIILLARKLKKTVNYIQIIIQISLRKKI